MLEIEGTRCPCSWVGLENSFTLMFQGKYLYSIPSFLHARASVMGLKARFRFSMVLAVDFKPANA